jgi:hypothetical protein
VQKKFSLKVIENIFSPTVRGQVPHTEFSVFIEHYSEQESGRFSADATYDALEFAWQGNGVAGKIQNFPSELRAAVKIRLPKGIGGWFSGRITDPRVVLDLKSNFDVLTIDALPSTVSRLKAFAPPTLAKNLLGDLPLGGIEATSKDSLLYVEGLKEYLANRSTGEASVWMVKSTFFKHECFPSNRLSGFISTNAMAYSASPPIFNEGYLDYKVAGMHLTSSGALTKGTYDLVLSSETARCLYKFSSAPISATISIIGSSGDTQSVKTSVLTERNGFLKLSAYGFTFSAPIVRVKLEQQSPKPLISQPLPRATKKVTITCSKRNVIKRITATKPSCPPGYKIK